MGDALAGVYRGCSGGSGPHRTGEGAYFGFRIPGLAYDAKHDVLMAFAQGMYTTCGFSTAMRAPRGAPDSSSEDNRVAPLGDLVLKRSLDGGNTFEPLQVVYNSSAYGTGAAWDPTPVYEPVTGTTFVFYAVSPAGEPIGTTKRRRWAYSSSVNGGTSWTYTDVSNACVPSNHPDTAFCGGHGTLLSSGRLLVPIYNNPGFTVCYSDDQGATWSSEGSEPYKTPSPDYNPAEAEIVELFQDITADHAAAHRLLVNFRYDGPMEGPNSCGKGVDHCRYFAFSNDSGLTWHNGTSMGWLPDPECKGGITRWDAGEALVAVGDDSDSARVNCTVFMSKDNGKTWPHKLHVSDDCGYSTVTMMRRRDRDIIVNMYDLSETCGINIALVDPNSV